MYQLLITRIRENIDRIVRGRITIQSQKRDRDNGRERGDELKDGARPPPACAGMHLPDYF